MDQAAGKTACAKRGPGLVGIEADRIGLTSLVPVDAGLRMIRGV